MSNPWFRMYSEFATDPKVQMMSESLQRRFVMLLCLRCNVTETLQETKIVTISDDEIAFQLRISDEEWEQTKAVFIAKNLIDEHNNPVAWSRRQYVTDSSAERVRRHREKKKQDEKRECNVTVTAPDTDTDTENISSNEDMSSAGAECQPSGENASDNPDLLGDDEQQITSPPDCPHQEIINLYHEILPMCPRVRQWTDTRRKYLQARWRDRLEDHKYSNRAGGLAYWRRYFQHVAQSRFLTGRIDNKDDRPPFTADLEWLVKSSNFTKVIEGKYHHD